MVRFVRILAVVAALVLSVGEAIAGLAQEDAACSDATVDTAIKLCSVVIDNKKQTNLNRAYAFANRCWAYNDKGNYSDAISDCSAAIKLNPKEDFAFAERCYAHIKYLDGFSEAIDDCKAAIKIKPGSFLAHYNLALAYAGRNDLAPAILEMTKAIKLKPKDKDTWDFRGSYYFRQKKYDLAIADFSEAIKLDKNFDEAYRERAEAKLAKGDLQGARSDVEMALSLNVGSSSSTLTLGEIQNAENWAKKRIADAEVPLQKTIVAPVIVPAVQPAFADVQKEFRACVSAPETSNYSLCTYVIANPQQTSVSKALAYYYRASGLAAQGRYKEVLGDADQSIKLYSESAGAHELRSRAYGVLGEYNKAIIDADTAVKINPKYALAFNERGWIRLRLQNFELARNDLNTAISLDAKNPESYRHLAEAELALGDLGKARINVEKALALKPDYVEAKQTLVDIAAAENKIRQTAVVAVVPQEKVAVVAEKVVPQTPVVVAPPPQKVIAPTPIPPKPNVVQKRVALVIGNSAYADGMALLNPTNDANAMAASLKRLGFEVILATDATKTTMSDAMYRFAVLSDSANAALVFYAGHGMQVDGVNYLMPVDASLETRADLKHKFVSADEILDDLRSVKGMRMMVLDACRNNPLSRSIKLKLAKLTSRAVDNRDGLADMKAEGVLIAFATQPNEVAADGDGADSPFTLALLKHLETPGIEIDTMFKRVRTTVSEMTDGVQLPQTVNSSTGEFYLKQN